MKNDIKFPIAAIVALLLLVPTSSAYGLAGAVFMKQVAPGQEISHRITVLNDENASLMNFTAQIYGFARDMNGIDIEVPSDEDTGSFTARPFLSIEPESFSLGPGEKKAVFINGTVPEDVGSGGKYALAAIKTAPRSSESVSVTTAIHAYVLLTVNDSELSQTGKIAALNASKTDKGADVSLVFENTGNVHYKPLIDAVLKNEAGIVLARGEIKEGAPSYVLPESSYIFRMKLAVDGGLSPGNCSLEARATLEDGSLLDSKEIRFEI